MGFLNFTKIIIPNLLKRVNLIKDILLWIILLSLWIFLKKIQNFSIIFLRLPNHTKNYLNKHIHNPKSYDYFLVKMNSSIWQKKQTEINKTIKILIINLWNKFKLTQVGKIRFSKLLMILWNNQMISLIRFYKQLQKGWVK